MTPEIETRKINIINWVSSLQEEETLKRIEDIQRNSKDWWDTISNEDKAAIKDGLNQLDKGDFLTRYEVRDKLKMKLNL